MHRTWLKFMTLCLLGASVALTGCEGDQGPAGPEGPAGQPGPAGPSGTTVVNATTTPDDYLETLDVVCEVTAVTIASPPVITFTYMTSDGRPIVGLEQLWENSNRDVRFTIAKLIAAEDGEPSRWVAYTRDESGEPDYDTGESLVAIGDGVYVFTMNTDVANVEGVPYEPTLTHRLAGQVATNAVALEYANPVFDFVPAGGDLPETRNIAVMESCNECHDGLVFHGRRFKVEYCVNCHNPDLAEGEANMSFMIHRIHSGGVFEALVDRNGDPYDYSHVTYPQDLANCSKCHNGADADTPDGDNWMTVPSMEACGGCHGEVSDWLDGEHPNVTSNSTCTACHNPNDFPIDESHATPNSTPNNPQLLDGQRSITYELMDAMDDDGDVVIHFRILSDGAPLDLTALPQDLLDGNRYPAFLLAWAEPQDGIEEPADFTNTGERGAQPLVFDLDEFSPISQNGVVGNLVVDTSGLHTATITAENFPSGATMRTVGLQGYLRQDLDDDGEQDVSLHTPSKVVTLDGDNPRRTVVDNARCGACHEWFEGHGGNRVYEMAICTMCHLPNTSSSGRTIDPTDIDQGLLDDFDDAHDLDPRIDPNDPLTYPEDAQNFKDLIHGIHSSAFRTRAYTHVRGGRQGYYDWSHVTFPAENGTRNCSLCHFDGTNELPLPANLLATTVRTTNADDGQDSSLPMVEDAFQSVPNFSDWINTPIASSCFYCHTSDEAAAHMKLNGGLVSNPASDGSSSGEGWFIDIVNRWNLIGNDPWPWIQPESCSVCHGPGKSADIAAVHSRD